MLVGERAIFGRDFGVWSSMMILEREREYVGVKSRFTGIPEVVIRPSGPSLVMVEVLPLKRSWKSILW